MPQKIVVCVLFLLTAADQQRRSANSFKLKIIHINDLHAMYDEITPKSKPCEGNECVGGIARLATTIKILKAQNPNHLILNAGDVFQGTVWYNLLKWNVSQHFMNLLGAQAMVLGNHEFDDTIAGLVPFLEATKGVTPVLVSNLVIPEGDQSENVTRIKDLVKREPFVINVGGKQVGIIGVIFDGTDKLSLTAPIKFRNSVDTVREQSKKLKQAGVDIVVVLSHCGIVDDRLIAEQAGDDIDVIAGGHSHTLLWNEEKAPSGHDVYGRYPLVINSSGGHRVSIVQALCHGLYVGNVDLGFDEKGEIVEFEGSPVYQDSTVEKDEKIDAELQKWKKVVAEKSSIVVDETKVELDNECREKECKIGSTLADAYLWYFRNRTNPPKIAFIHAGTFRNSLQVGNITTGQIMNALPFSTYASVIKISGKTLEKAIDFGSWMNRRCKRNLLQVAGIKAAVDYSKPEGSKTMIFIKVGDGYQFLDVNQEYVVVTNSYIVKGGDDFDMFEGVSVEERGPIDSELLQLYFGADNGFNEESLSENRIQLRNPQLSSEEIQKCLKS
uniref:Apyrase n=1 Tax=Culex quinquefasciatus TaxID=7176 RepID=Q6TS14_CULQU|nr:salivary apyrase [Culex quinquefasciatus]